MKVMVDQLWCLGGVMCPCSLQLCPHMVRGAGSSGDSCTRTPNHSEVLLLTLLHWRLVCVELRGRQPPGEHSLALSYNRVQFQLQLSLSFAHLPFFITLGDAFIVQLHLQILQLPRLGQTFPPCTLSQHPELTVTALSPWTAFLTLWAFLFQSLQCLTEPLKCFLNQFKFLFLSIPGYDIVGFQYRNSLFTLVSLT